MLNILATLSLLAAAAAAYPLQYVTTTLTCRSGPGTSYAVVRSYTPTAQVTISCQAYGTAVNGNQLWDRTQDGCYVSDYYVNTGCSACFVAPQCSTSGSGTPCATLNTASLDLVKSFEGFSATRYLDPVGLPTIGYGHLCTTNSCSEVNPPLTVASATTLLLNDMRTYTACVNQYVNNNIILNDNQLGALSSWTYNVGCGAVQTSTLIARLNAGESPNTVAAQELPKWKYAGGQVLPGLVTRRQKEVELFQKASSKQAHPSCQ